MWREPNSVRTIIRSLPLTGGRQYQVYRWRYDLRLLREPMIYFLVWKIFFWIITAAFVLVLIFDAFNWSDFFFARCLDDLKFYGYFLLGMTAVSFLGYFIYAWTMGWKSPGSSGQNRLSRMAAMVSWSSGSVW